MPKYFATNDALVVTMTLQDILHHAVYVPFNGDKRWNYVGDLECIIKFIAWRMVGIKRPDIVKQKYAYGYVELNGEEIKVTFVREHNDIPEAPKQP
jgi:hypothetical protein